MTFASRLHALVWVAALAVIGMLAGPALDATGGVVAQPPKSKRKPKHRHGPLTKPGWLGHVELTEYYPVPERWFAGRKVLAPGLTAPHRLDWLYSARGVSMEGDGIDLAGHHVHVEQRGADGWIDAEGKPTRPRGKHWTRGVPFWRTGAYWRNARGKPTFPLADGGWFDGDGRRYVELPGATFAAGMSRPLSYYHSVAVDPRLIPLGSRIYIPAYRGVGGGDGWFTAADIGSAIIGRHLDVYRPPPASSADPGNLVTDTRVYVIPVGPATH